VNQECVFQPYGVAHLTAIFLTIALPFVLGLVVRRTKSQFMERTIVFSLSALLISNYVIYMMRVRQFGAVSWQQTLPLQLCDWAMVVVIVAMVSGNQRWFEVAYFWGIGGTLQAVLTPNLRYGFPDFRFFSFFIAHSGIIIGVVFLMLVRRYRPYPMSILRTLVWTEFYFVVTFVADALTGFNYGFLLHKPEAFSILNFLSDWRPLYLVEFHALAWLFFGLLYLPFAVFDLIRKRGDSVAAVSDRR
jgi:hypothetical integral membrane protein (TIGR02206 family)